MVRGQSTGVRRAGPPAMACTTELYSQNPAAASPPAHAGLKCCCCHHFKNDDELQRQSHKSGLTPSFLEGPPMLCLAPGMTTWPRLVNMGFTSPKQCEYSLCFRTLTTRRKHQLRTSECQKQEQQEETGKVGKEGPVLTVPKTSKSRVLLLLL